MKQPYNINDDMLFRLGMLNTRRIKDNIQLNDRSPDELPISTYTQIFKMLK